MESTNLDMAEIFDDNDDDDIGATGVLPDLPEATQSQENEDEENAEVLARLKDLSKGASKKVVRKPQPKLDPTRLTGERGIPILTNKFQNVKFKGKGHETEDLALIMRQMEHWAHRLFPKMLFDEVTERVEKLGSKKEVQTCVKKMRLDMPILDNDFVGSDREDDDARSGDGEPEKNPKGDVRVEDMWDDLLREEAEQTVSQSKPEASQQPSDIVKQADTPLQKADNYPGEFTPEQQKRIEKNKQLAMERRLKKLTAGTRLSSSQTPSTTSSQTPSTTSSQTPSTSSQTPSTTSSQTPSTTSSQTPSTTDMNDATSSKPDESISDKSDGEVAEVQQDTEESRIYGETSTNVDSDMSEVLNKGPKQSRIHVEASQRVDSEMSEVLIKGPSQNIVVDDKCAQNAQNWHTGAASSDETGLILGSGSPEESETKGTSNDDINQDSEMHDEAATSEEMSVIIENQDVKSDLHGVEPATNESMDTQGMSEVIEKQDQVNVMLKEKLNGLHSDCINTLEISQIIENQDSKLKVSAENIQGKEDYEDSISMCKDTKDVLVTDKFDMMHDNSNIVINPDDFDDEMMDTLES